LTSKGKGDAGDARGKKHGTFLWEKSLKGKKVKSGHLKGRLATAARALLQLEIPQARSRRKGEVTPQAHFEGGKNKMGSGLSRGEEGMTKKKKGRKRTHDRGPRTPSEQKPARGGRKGEGRIDCAGRTLNGRQEKELGDFTVE